jgi:hypothetical protein
MAKQRMDVALFVASAIGAACLVGIGARAVSRWATRRRSSHRGLFWSVVRVPGGPNFEMLQVGTNGAIVLRYSPFVAHRVGSDPFTIFALLHGACSCAYHSFRPRLDMGPLVSRVSRVSRYGSRGEAAIDAITLLNRCAHLFLGVVDSDRFETLTRVGAAFSVCTPLGACALLGEGVARFCVEAWFERLGRRHCAAKERRERTRIAHHAFFECPNGSGGSGGTDNGVVYLHQDPREGIKRGTFLMSTVCGEFGGRRLTTRVDFSDEKDVIVNVYVDHLDFGRVGDPTAACAPPSPEDVVLGLRSIRSALSCVSEDAFVALLRTAAGEALARTVAANAREARAQRVIRRAWTAAVSDPAHPACVRRLRREIEGLVVVS